MELKHAVIESIHDFKHENFDIIGNKPLNQSQIQIVKHKDSQRSFYLIQKGEKYNSDEKYSYINYLEKSTNLIHPAIINLSGYSTEKPYLYYKHIQEASDINFSQMKNDNIQKIFIGVASGLSYLFKNGYSYSNFSIDSIIFDKVYCPKLIGYINFEDRNLSNEKSLIQKYVDTVKQILRIKFAPSKNFNKHINENFASLLEKNNPTFDNFIELLTIESFIVKGGLFNWMDVKQYKKNLVLCDTIIFDKELSLKASNHFDSIEKICYHFYDYDKKNELSKERLYLLNFLPENYIKSIVKLNSPLSEKLNRFVFNENISLIIPNWRDLQKLNPFLIYREIMDQMQLLEKQKTDTLFCDIKSKEVSYKIESLRNQAIQYLFKASEEQPELIGIKIEIAIQYIKGYILEYSLDKALSVLESIPETVNIQTVKQMKDFLKTKIEETSIQNVVSEYHDKISKEKVNEAEKGDVFSMLYLGFAFYTGFNGYPVLHSLSHHYYEKAAEKSPYAMLLVGYLYYKGIIFPQNLHKAQECFKKSAQNGCLKAEIIDNLLRKHVWRSYLADFDIDEIFTCFIQPFDIDNILLFSKINYDLENNSLNGKLHELSLENSKDNLYSNYIFYKKKQECNSKSLLIKETDHYTINIKPEYSQKVLLTSDDFENTEKVDKQLYYAKSYFYGDNGFPVNYNKSAKFFKLAANNGNSEAQWRFALMINHQIGNIPSTAVESYLKKSAEQNDIKGKFYYSIYLKNKVKDTNLFSKIINECCEAKDLDAMYYYGMYLEELIKQKEIELEKKSKLESKSKSKSNLDYDSSELNIHDEALSILESSIRSLIIQFSKDFSLGDTFYKNLSDSIFNQNSDEDNETKDTKQNEEILQELQRMTQYYKILARQCHFDAFNRLVNLINPHEIQSYEEYLPIGLISDTFLSKLIEFYDKNQEYTKSNILIQIGLIKNPKLFNFYYCDHLLNQIDKVDKINPNLDIRTNLERAKKLAILAFQKENNYPKEYQEKYIYIILRSLVIDHEHEKALQFLLKYKDLIHIKYKDYFQLFYKKFDKRLASDNFIPACFYRKQYRYCHELFFSGSNNLNIFGKLIEYAEEDDERPKDHLECNNPFAMAILGKIYKQEKKGLMRNMDFATKYFMRSAKNNCPLGQYYLGKEYYYGRYLSKNKKKAIEYLELAIKLNREPRAGYYLFKLTRNLDYLKVGVEYGHSRALLKYGRILYDEKGKRNEAIGYIRQACSQKFKKAYTFCIHHGIHFIEMKETYSKNKQKNVKETYSKNKQKNVKEKGSKRKISKQEFNKKVAKSLHEANKKRAKHLHEVNKDEDLESSGLSIHIPDENELNAKFKNKGSEKNDNSNNNNNNNNNNNDDDDIEDESISSFSGKYWI